MKFLEHGSSELELETYSLRNKNVDEGLSRCFNFKRRLSMQEAATLESAIRKLVREELDHHYRLCFESSLKPPLKLMDAAVSRKCQLHFANSLPNVLYTSNKIESDGNKPLEIVVKDASSNEIIKTSPWSSVKIEIVVMSGDFGNDVGNNWSAEEFDASVMHAREGRRPLVAGDRYVTLVNGVGYLGGLFFTDNSSWVRSRKFKLGARAVRKSSDGENIREAISGAFIVKDQRGGAYQKHYPPSLSDEIWRLEKIRKDGVFHSQLAANGIQTVQDFLRFLTIDPLSLRKIFSNMMSDRVWNIIVGHATTCTLDDKMYAYTQVQAEHQVELLFDSIFAVVGAIFNGGNFVPKDKFSTSNLKFVEDLKKQAYQHQKDIVEIDGVKADLLLESGSKRSLENYLTKRARRDLNDKAETDGRPVDAPPFTSPFEASLFPESVVDLPSKSQIELFSADHSAIP